MIKFLRINGITSVDFGTLSDTFNMKTKCDSIKVRPMESCNDKGTELKQFTITFCRSVQNFNPPHWGLRKKTSSENYSYLESESS